ncbi:MAG: WD40 repeat domain-containing protein, partial [Gammaproteobacteria bacterium]
LNFKQLLDSWSNELVKLKEHYCQLLGEGAVNCYFPDSQTNLLAWPVVDSLKAKLLERLNIIKEKIEQFRQKHEPIIGVNFLREIQPDKATFYKGKEGVFDRFSDIHSSQRRFAILNSRWGGKKPLRKDHPVSKLVSLAQARQQNYDWILKKIPSLITDSSLNLQGLPISDEVLTKIIESHPYLTQIDLRGCTQITLQGYINLIQHDSSLQRIVDNNYSVKPVNQVKQQLQQKLLSIEVINDRQLACGTDNGEILLFDANTLKCRAEFQAHDQPICILAASPDGILLASTSYDKTNTTIKLWNIYNQHCTQTIEAYESEITTLKWLNNEILISGARKGVISFWDKTTGICTNVYNDEHYRGQEIILWNSSTVIYGTMGEIKLYNFITNRIIATLKIGDGFGATIAKSSAFSKLILQENQLQAIGSDNFLYIWHLDKIELDVYTTEQRSPLPQLDPDNTCILYLGKEQLYIASDRTVKLYNISTKKHELVQDHSIISESITHMILLSDG